MITGIFVSLSRVMPDRYPLTRDLQWYIDNEHGFGRILDLGLIQPRFGELYFPPNIDVEFADEPLLHPLWPRPLRSPKAASFRRHR